MPAAVTPRLFIAYVRVSTAKQGRSGLGLEAQEAAIRAFLHADDRLLMPLYVEVESGRHANRPKLTEALTRCRETGATLLIAKLDRLSRDAPFLLGLQASGVEFIACDMPHANRLTVGIMALVAEEEARMISARTKAALAAAKARGVDLGGDRGYRPTALPAGCTGGSEAAAAARRKKAMQDAWRVLPAIERAEAVGAKSLAAIAAHLMQEGVPTPRGGTTWTETSVRRARMRVSAMQAG